MRVAVISSFFPTKEQPYRGHAAYQTLRELRRYVEVEVFCPIAKYPSLFRPRTFDYVKPDLNHSLPDLSVHYFEYPTLPMLGRPVNPLLCARTVLPSVRTFGPDIILNYYIYPEGCAAIHVGRQLDIPVVLGARGSDLNRIPDPATKSYVRWALHHASFVLTVSHHLRDQAINFGVPPDRARAILNSCDQSVFHPKNRTEARRALGIDYNGKIIVFVGRLVASKGVRELLDATNILIREGAEVRLIYVGEGMAQRELQQLAGENFSSRIMFVGRCTSEQIAQFLAAADLFCLPSYAEGCPNVVIEALASGRPVVATNVGGIPELVDTQRGILVPPRNVLLLANAIRDALAQPWDEHQIASRFQGGWKNVASETYACLKLCTHPQA